MLKARRCRKRPKHVGQRVALQCSKARPIFRHGPRSDLCLFDDRWASVDARNLGVDNNSGGQCWRPILAAIFGSQLRRSSPAANSNGQLCGDISRWLRSASSCRHARHRPPSTPLLRGMLHARPPKHAQRNRRGHMLALRRPRRRGLGEKRL